jgi:tetratricopeptide (TPR) repeat protein
MRTSAQIFLLALLVLSCTVSTYAQETLWEELTTKFMILYQKGRYSEAITVAEKALKVAEKLFDSTHPNFATALNNLAAIYRAQGRYTEAEPLYKPALAI